MRRLVPVTLHVLLVGYAVLLGACVRTPKQLCQETFDALNEMLVRCDLTGEFYLVHPSTRERVSCDEIVGVRNAETIVQECLPWARDEGVCETLTFDGAGMIEILPACDAGNFEVP